MPNKTLVLLYVMQLSEAIRAWNGEARMNARELITNAINVKAPWSVANESVDTGKYPNEVQINVIADVRQTYHCPHCEKKRRVRDMVSIVWHHQNFFELSCFIVAQVPVIDCPSHGMVKVDVPWIRPASRIYSREVD